MVARARDQDLADWRRGTISWALHALACRPQRQSRLRTECQAYGESLPFEQLDQLPYLDAVVMEVLRVYPSLPSTVSGIASLPRSRPT
jgi:cytochrome P450